MEEEEYRKIKAEKELEMEKSLNEILEKDKRNENQRETEQPHADSSDFERLIARIKSEFFQQEIASQQESEQERKPDTIIAEEEKKPDTAIAEEERKPDAIVIHETAAEYPDAEELLARIKMEPVEKPTIEDMPQPMVVIARRGENENLDSEPAKKPVYECEFCDKKYTAERFLKKHFDKTHSPSSVPDVNDPNNYCKRCRRTFRSVNFYRRHLRVKHNMDAEPVPIPAYDDVVNDSTELVPIPAKKRKRGPQPEPRFNAEMTYHCSLCDKSIVNKRRFLGHIRRVHNIGDIDDKELEDDTDLTTDYRLCKICHRSFPDTLAHDEHVRQDHPAEPPVQQPKVEDTSYMYDTSGTTMKCRFCSIESLSQEGYRDHLKEAHQDRLNPLVSRIVQPYAEDKKPEVFCVTCQIKMETLGDCLTHLRKAHNLNVFPDPKLIIDQAVAQFRESGQPMIENEDDEETESFTNLVQFLMKNMDE